MNQEKSRIHSRIKLCITLIIIGLLSILRIILAYNQELVIVEGSVYDDILQIQNALSIADGEWMGPYENPILCKNPGFPIFLSISAAFHIPYTLMYGLLIVGSCLFLIWAISPVVRSYGYRVVVYAVMIFLPINSEAVHRIYRNALVPYFVILVVSALIGLYLRRDKGIANRVLWSVFGFISLSGFYILREDGIWITPFVGVVCGILIIQSLIKIKHKTKPIVIIGLVITSIIPILAIPTVTKVVEKVNYNHYGISLINDRTTGNEARLIGLLYQMKEGSRGETVEDRDLWVSTATLETAMDVSPTLAQAKEIFDYIDVFGPVFKSKRGECNGDGIVWAIRNGVSDAGFYKSAKLAEDFYGAAADEIEKAYKDGAITKKEGITISNAIVPLRSEDFMESLSLGLQVMNTLSHFPDSQTKSQNDTDVSYETIALAQRATAIDISNDKSGLATDISNFIGKIYGIASYPIRIVLIILYGMATVLLLIKKIPKKIKKRQSDLWLMATGTFLCAFSNVYISVLFLRFISNHKPRVGVFGFYDPAAVPLMYLAGMLAAYACYKLLKGYSRHGHSSKESS